MWERLRWGVVGGIVALALTSATCASMAAAPAPAVPPVVAGYHRLKDDPKAGGAAAAGELLLAELNCTACHKPQEDAASQRVGPKGAPDLASLGGRRTPQWLSAYL